MRVSFLAAILALSAGACAMHADPVTYTLSGTMTGTLGIDSFTDAAVTFTFLGDTSNTIEPVPGIFLNTIGASTVTVAGIGTATINGSTFGVEASDFSAGFFDGAGFNVGILDFALTGYDLTGPFSDTGFFVNGGSGITGPEGTSLGDLTITDLDFQHLPTTFTASAVGGVVPEPSSFMLLGTGLVGLIGAARRRLA